MNFNREIFNAFQYENFNCITFQWEIYIHIKNLDLQFIQTLFYEQKKSASNDHDANSIS